jgi:flagella basal body P-ring formation protein FlgA
LSLLLTAATAATVAAAIENKGELRIYVMRDVASNAESLTLSDICVVRCDDRKLRQQILDVKMGRGAVAGETLEIDRRTILSRLGTEGIDTRDISFSGAEAAEITRIETTVESDKLLRLARLALAKQAQIPAGCSWNPAAAPRDMIVPGEDVALVPSVSGEGNRRRVVIAAVREGETLAKTQIDFSRTYRVQRAVALRDIPAGSLVTESNARIETVESDRPGDDEFATPIGKLVTVDVDAGTVLRPGLVKAPSREIVVKRNQAVQMKIVAEGFSILAGGKALEDGRVGDYVKVRNVDSQRIIVARVAADGTVEPVMKR